MKCNPNDEAEICDRCGERTAYLVNRNGRITLECDCGWEWVVKYERDTMRIPEGQKAMEVF